MTKDSLQAKVVSLKAQRNDLINAAKKENRDLTADEGQKFDALGVELESTKRNIDRLVAVEGENRQGPRAQLRDHNPNSEVDPEDDMGNNPLGVPEKDLAKYSVMRAIRCLAIDKKPLDGIEGEVSREIAKRSGKNPHGFYLYGSTTSAIEGRTLRERRALDTSAGVGGINQTVLYQSFIEKLRHRTLIDKIGARYMAGLVGKFYLPRQSATGTAYWLGENGSPTTSSQAIDQVALTPNTLGAYTDLTRQFVEQTSLDAEAFVRDDLARVLAIEIDRAAFAGDGTSNAPTGLLHISGISHNVRSGPGSALSWDDVVGMETAVAAADADMGNLSYVTNTKVRGLLKTTLRSNVAGAKYIWDDNNTINGYPAFAGNNIPSNNGPEGSEAHGSNSSIIFGDFSSLVVAMWGGLDIMVDPYTLSSSGGVRIVALQDIDIKVRHNQSFYTIDDVAA